MKFIIVAAVALVAVAAALPVEEPVEIVNSVFEQQADGGYKYAFGQSDGVKREETGVVKEAFDEDNKPHNVVVVRGSYSYINPNGQEELINYTADEEGFHPEGSSIPVAPVARR
ncbi:larval cuticle protein 1-like [Trichoplusia ni]|uniref:Larval cuticle protein 1-like n=1 Tax=Trichoplusia ni TaxID=7111 RepID=A0A7E5VM53_TRINI|nr:larval cuticle protein 1-like [Trichoplusia ni]